MKKYIVGLLVAVSLFSFAPVVSAQSNILTRPLVERILTFIQANPERAKPLIDLIQSQPDLLGEFIRIVLEIKANPNPTNTIPGSCPNGVCTNSQLQVTNPQAGNRLVNGGDKDQIAVVQWRQVGSNHPVAIYLLNPSGSVVRTITSRTTNNGSFVWSHDPTLPNGSYEIYIEALTNQAKGPSSRSGLFAVTDNNSSCANGACTNKTINIISPNGGEVLRKVNGYLNLPYSWSASYVPQQPTLSVYRASDPNQSIVSKIVNSGIANNNNGWSGEWNMNSSVSSQMTPGSYFVTLCDQVEGNQICDRSDNFTITDGSNQDNLRVTVILNEGSNLPVSNVMMRGARLPITWREEARGGFSIADYPSISLGLINADTNQAVAILADSLSAGQENRFNWTIGRTYNNRGVVPDGRYKIRVAYDSRRGLPTIMGDSQVFQLVTP